MISTLKKIILLLPAALVSFGAFAANYKLVWDDEFNGSALDTDAWNIEVNGDGGGNSELQYYRAENISIEKDPSTGAGCLVLTARKESYQGKSFTSGRLNTMDKVIFTRGKIESRIKMPKTANGLWPAFWMLGNDYKTLGWPRCGEIDIVEMGNATGISQGTQDRYFNGACHWGYYKDGNYPNYARATTWPTSLQDGEFHTFTLEWDEQYVSMYVDRDQNPNVEPYYKMGVSDTNGDWATGLYFQHDFFIVYDLAVGGNFTGITSAGGITALSDGEAKMWIDWVRVYQEEDDTNAIVPDSWQSGISDEDTEAPVITSATVSNVSCTTAELSLTATDNLSSSIYFTATDKSDSTQYKVTGKTGEATTLSLTGLSSGAQYTLSVVAADELGNTSAAREVTFTTSSLPAIPEPTATVYKSLFSPYLGNADGYWFNSWGGGSGAAVSIEGKEGYQISNFMYFGSEFTAIDVTGYETLHLDVLPLQDMTLCVVPITGTIEKGVTFDLTAGQWNTLEVPVATYTTKGCNMANLYQIKYVSKVASEGENGVVDGFANGDGTQSFIVGNVYFHTHQSGGISDVEAAAQTADGPAYNVAGQIVGGDYKGIVIVGGKKEIRK